MRSSPREVSGAALRQGGSIDTNQSDARQKGEGLDPVPRFGLSELILRVADVPRSVMFYRDVVGLSVEGNPSATWAWLWTGAPGALPRHGITSRPLSYGAGHCGGPAHFAIAIARERISDEKSRLESLGLEVEGPVTFESWNADTSYFSDPDNHRVELCGFEHLNGLHSASV
jgi:catechol 2,3-dioxygenase-like lactoylglutathione lyase family enzyme